MCWLSNLFKSGQPGLQYPNPPQGNVVINANQVFNLLRSYGINIIGGASDWDYLLMTREDANRFMSWYKKNAPIKPGDYTPDALDCDDFGWIMRAHALIWTKGRYLWGYTESESIDPNYPFPNHGFCFTITDEKKVWFADVLSVAAPDDKIMEAYSVKCHMAKC